MNVKEFDNIIRRNFEVVSVCPWAEGITYTLQCGMYIGSHTFYYKDIESKTIADVFVDCVNISKDVERIRLSGIYKQLETYYKSRNCLNNVIYTDFMKGIK